MVHATNNSQNGNGHMHSDMRQDLSERKQEVFSDSGVDLSTEVAEGEVESGAFTFTTLEALEEKLRGLGYKGILGIALLGGLGRNFFLYVLELNPNDFPNLRILFSDADISGFAKTFTPRTIELIRRWGSSITFLPVGGPESEGGGAGASPEKGEQEASHPSTLRGIREWLKNVHIVVSIFGAAGGSGAGLSVKIGELVKQTEKLGINCAIMPDEEEEAYRVSSATDVLQKSATILPTLTLHTFGIYKWLVERKGQDEVDSFTRPELWKEMDRLMVWPSILRLFDLMMGVGSDQNMDIQNLKRLMAVEPNATNRYLLEGYVELTPEQMRNPASVDPIPLVEKMFDDDRGLGAVPGASEKIRGYMIEIKGGWKEPQYRVIDSSMRANIKAKTDKPLMNFRAISSELPEGVPWSFRIIAIAVDVGEISVSEPKVAKPATKTRSKKEKVKEFFGIGVGEPETPVIGSAPDVPPALPAPMPVTEATEPVVVQQEEAAGTIPAEEPKVVEAVKPPVDDIEYYRPTPVVESAQSPFPQGSIAAAPKVSLKLNTDPVVRFTPKGEKLPRAFEVSKEVQDEFNRLDDPTISEEEAQRIIALVGVATKGSFPQTPPHLRRGILSRIRNPFGLRQLSNTSQSPTQRTSAPADATT